MLNKELLLTTEVKSTKLHISRRQMLNGNYADIIIFTKDGIQRTLENYELDYQEDLSAVDFISVSPMDWVTDETYEEVDTYTNLDFNYISRKFTVIDYSKDAFLNTRPVYPE